MRAPGDDAAVVWDGPAALVPVRLGGRGAVGSGDPGRGTGFHPVAAGGGQACPAALASSGRPGAARPAARPAPNPVTGKAPPGPGYAPATVAHCETVVREFYEFHLQAGTGPMVNPFPLARGRGGRRPHAHRNPDGAVPRGAQRVVPAEGRRGAGRGRSRMRSSTSCSRRWARTGTGRWWRSGCRPGCARRSCSARPRETPTRASS